MFENHFSGRRVVFHFFSPHFLHNIINFEGAEFCVELNVLIPNFSGIYVLPHSVEQERRKLFLRQRQELT
jgi:hypothetical protein